MKNFFIKTNYLNEYFSNNSGVTSHLNSSRFMSSGALNAYRPLAGSSWQNQNTSQKTQSKDDDQNSIVDTVKTRIRSFSELDAIMRGQNLDPSTSKIDPETWQALMRGEEVEVMLHKRAPERANLIAPLLGSIMAITGGDNTAYNDSLFDALIGNREKGTSGIVNEAADFVGKHGTSWSWNGGLGGQHSDIEAQFTVVKDHVKAKKPEVEIPIVPNFRPVEKPKFELSKISEGDDFIREQEQVDQPKQDWKPKFISTGDRFRGSGLGISQYHSTTVGKVANETGSGLDQTRETVARQILQSYGSESAIHNLEDGKISFMGREGETPLPLNAKSLSGTSPEASAKQQAISDWVSIASSSTSLVNIPKEDIEQAVSAAKSGNPDKLFELFTTVENKLHKEYGLVADQKFGAQHITALQDAVIDNSQRLNGMAVVQGMKKQGMSDGQILDVLKANDLDSFDISFIMENYKKNPVSKIKSKLENIASLSDNKIFQHPQLQQMVSEIKPIVSESGPLDQINDLSVVETTNTSGKKISGSLMKEYETTIGLRENFGKDSDFVKLLESSGVPERLFKDGDAVSPEKAKFLATNLRLGQEVGGLENVTSDNIKSLTDEANKIEGQSSTFGLDQSKENIARTILSKYDAVIPKGKPTDTKNVVEIVVTEGTINSEPAKTAVSDYLKVAKEAGLIEDFSSENLFISFKSVEGVLNQKYGLKVDGMIGAEHINDLQSAVIDQAKGLRGAASIINRVANGETLSDTEIGTLKKFGINKSNIGDKQVLSGALDKIVGKLESLQSTVKSTNYSEHGQLKQLDAEINSLLGDDVSGVKGLSKFLKTSREPLSENEKVEVRHFQNQTLLSIGQLETAIEMGVSQVKVSGEDVSIRSAIETLQDQYEGFLLKGFDIDHGDMSDISDRLAGLRRSVGMDGADDVGDAFMLLRDASDSAKEKIVGFENQGKSEDQKITGISQLTERFITQLPDEPKGLKSKISELNTKSPLVKEDIVSLLDNIHDDMEGLQNSRLKEDYKEGKDPLSTLDNITLQFLSVAEHMLNRAKGEDGSGISGSTDLTNDFRSYLKLGNDFNKAMKKTLTGTGVKTYTKEKSETTSSVSSK